MDELSKERSTEAVSDPDDSPVAAVAVDKADDRAAVEPDDDQPVQRIAIERHRRGNRWMHWINFPVLTIMIWSGLRIYWADLRDPFGVGVGAVGWHWFDLFPDWFNESLGLERRLARGMAFHFFFGWFFTLNGVAFGIYLWRTGGWRNFVPTLADLRTIPAVLLHECRIRKEAPPQGKYNGVQQLSYGLILVMGVLAILSGFAIYRPTQLSPLTAAFGGYESARFVHFWVTIGFMLFFVIHILQVARAGFKSFWSMVTGYELLDVPASAAASLAATDTDGGGSEVGDTDGSDGERDDNDRDEVLA